MNNRLYDPIVLSARGTSFALPTAQDWLNTIDKTIIRNVNTNADGTDSWQWLDQNNQVVQTTNTLFGQQSFSFPFGGTYLAPHNTNSNPSVTYQELVIYRQNVLNIFGLTIYTGGS